MDEHTTPDAGDPAAPAGSAGRSFQSPEGLRALLIRLHESGPGAWRCDREAAELMRYTAMRYRRLARKHELEAWAVACAAFEVMLTPSVRNASNPWAMVTRAVQITCRVEVRAGGLLVSTGKVRHSARIAGFHDAVRFAERERLADYHPAFAVARDDEDLEPVEDDGRVAAIPSETVALFVSAGWDAALVADCVEHVAYRLADLFSWSRAVEVLRIWMARSALKRSTSCATRSQASTPARTRPSMFGTPYRRRGERRARVPRCLIDRASTS